MFRKKVTIQEMERVLEQLTHAETALRRAQSECLTAGVSRRLNRQATRVQLDRENIRDEISRMTPNFL